MNELLFKHTIGYFIFVIFTLFFVTVSQGHANDKPIKDWVALQNKLREYGIQPTDTNWSIVQTMCQSYIDGSDKRWECLLEKSLLQKQFSESQAYCKKRSLLLWPDAYTNPKDFDITSVDSDGNKYKSTFTYRRYTKQEIDGMRELHAQECMYLLGWRSPNDWKLGRESGFIR